MKTADEQIRACYAAYENKDRAAIEAILSDDFTFSSPLDDNIDRETYFKRCWPNSEHLDKFDIKQIFTQASYAFVRYECQPKGQPKFQNTEFFTFDGDKIKHVDVYFGSETGEAAAEAEIRSVVEAWAEGIRQKNVEAVAVHFAPDSVAFLLAPPLVADEPIRKNLTEWFATFSGPIGYELRDLKIATSGDLAYCHSLNHLTGTKNDGEKPDVWFRETLCLRQLKGQWLITHAHESVPFYMDGSLKAAVDLKP